MPGVKVELYCPLDSGMTPCAASYVANSPLIVTKPPMKPDAWPEVKSSLLVAPAPAAVTSSVAPAAGALTAEKVNCVVPDAPSISVMPDAPEPSESAPADSVDAVDDLPSKFMFPPASVTGAES